MEISRKTALEVLGLNEGFSEEELTKAFRRLSKLVHPDMGGDAGLFKLIVCCKEKLSNNKQDDVKENDVSPQPKKNNNCKKRGCIKLTTLYDIFYFLSSYISEYDITEIIGIAKIYITKRNKCQEMSIYFQQLFRDFLELGFANFSATVVIPESLKNFKTLKVRV